MEAKLQEGKKPAKDKNPAETFTIDYTLISEPFCLGLPQDLLQKALAYSVNSNKTAVRKGMILDVWEKSAFDSIKDVRTCFDLLWNSEEDHENVSLDLILELTVSRLSFQDGN